MHSLTATSPLGNGHLQGLVPQGFYLSCLFFELADRAEHNTQQEPPVRIAIVAPFFHQQGGIERYVWNLAHELAADHQVTVFAARFAATETNNLRWQRVPAITRYWPLLTLTFPVMAQLILARRRGDFDVVHGHGASLFSQDVLTAHSVHKAWFLTSLAALKPGSKGWWLKLLNPLHYITILVETIQMMPAMTRKVIAISGVIEKELTKFYRIDPWRMQIVVSGVGHKEFSPSSADDRRTLKTAIQINPDDLLLLFVGNEYKRKNLATVFEAVAKLQDLRLHVGIVGRADPHEFRNLAERLGIATRVHFFGPSSNMGQYYGAADMFVFPTLYEAFSLVILEAMAAGLPIITTDGVGAVSELFTDNTNGLLLKNPVDRDELADKISQLTDPKERSRLGRAAYEKSLEFSWTRMAQNYLKTYV
jgi:UDP-glucose:(heptosyl)LPS alpha-1,3-glucosyltransferase